MVANLKPLALYIHIPFCKAKCTYCDFYSIVGREASIPVYLKMIIKEIEHTVSQIDLSHHYIDTIFLGGGTPNLLSPSLLEQLMTVLMDLTATGNAMEVGMEINPGEATLDNLLAYKALGVNRISIGMQSFQPNLLKFMSRIHSVEQSFATYYDVRKAGFTNVSADLIFAVPGQSRAVWEADLQRLIELEPEHISTYSLTVEEGTALHRWVDAGHVHMLEETVDTGMYATGRDFLEAAGYPNYEISNHARPGYECRHNLNYWTGVEYLGFGPAAHSYFQGRRHWNVRDLDQYNQQVSATGSSVEDSEMIDQNTARNEMILTRLRLSEGLDLNEYIKQFGEDLLVVKKQALDKWTDHISVVKQHLIISRSGWSLIDEISSDLMAVES